MTDDWGDPFTDRGMRLLFAVLLLVALATVFGLALIYYGDSYAVPSWNERCVPPPKPF